MTVLDLGNNIAVTRQITPQVLSASSSDATAVDLAGETYAIVVIDCGTKAGTTSAYTFKVEEASDNALTVKSLRPTQRLLSRQLREQLTIVSISLRWTRDASSVTSESLAISPVAVLTTSPFLAASSLCPTTRAMLELLT
jgi:hypothetical protein